MVGSLCTELLAVEENGLSSAHANGAVKGHRRGKATFAFRREDKKTADDEIAARADEPIAVERRQGRLGRIASDGQRFRTAA
jgi:hypothetical protein